MRRLAPIALVLAGCFDPIQETTRPIKEAARAREAGKWAGTYVFGECAQSGQCWRYEVAVTTGGDAVFSVLGDPKPLRMNAKPRVTENGMILSFVSYVDEGVDMGDVGFRAFDPLRGRFSPNQRLGTISSNGACFTFESLESKIGAKTICR